MVALRRFRFRTLGRRAGRCSRADGEPEVPRTSDSDQAQLTAKEEPSFLERTCPVFFDDLGKELRKVWVPAIFNSILPCIVGTVDLFWIGRLRDPIAVAGMGAANQIFNTVYTFMSFLPGVLMPTVAAHMAKNEQEKAAEVIYNALCVTGVLGLLGFIAIMLFPESILWLVVDHPAMLAQAVPYLRWRGLGLVLSLWGNVAFGAFRGVMDLTTPLAVNLVVQILNIALDPFLMFGLGLGAAGAAGATTISEFVGTAASLFLLFKKGMLPKKLRLPKVAGIRTLMSSGLGVLVRSVATNAMLFFSNRRVNHIDDTGVQAAAFQVTMNWWNLAGYISLALSSAGSSWIANKINKEGRVAARKAASRLTTIGAISGAILGLLQLAMLPLGIFGLLAPTKEVAQASLTPLVLAAILQALNGWVFAGEGIVMGTKGFWWAAWGSVSGTILMVLIIHLFGNNALLGVWIGLFAFNFARLAFSTLHRLRYGPLAPSQIIKD
mmetsp:Transcript_70855/g.169648  ORF Transcript_70855/g.169648 Transcript_70855/m.169648 type:complete len:494 (-) Transcript_70855:140-1621(-)